MWGGGARAPCALLWLRHWFNKSEAIFWVGKLSENEFLCVNERTRLRALVQGFSHCLRAWIEESFLPQEGHCIAATVDARDLAQVRGVRVVEPGVAIFGPALDTKKNSFQKLRTTAIFHCHPSEQIFKKNYLQTLCCFCSAEVVTSGRNCHIWSEPA